MGIGSGVNGHGAYSVGGVEPDGQFAFCTAFTALDTFSRTGIVDVVGCNHTLYTIVRGAENDFGQLVHIRSRVTATVAAFEHNRVGLCRHRDGAEKKDEKR